MTKDSIKFNGQLDLSSEYSQFMSNFQKNVLVSFGTTHMPNEELGKMLVETFVNFQYAGFVVSLKDTDDVRAYSIVKALIEEKKLKNVMLRNFLP